MDESLLQIDTCIVRVLEGDVEAFRHVVNACEQQVRAVVAAIHPAKDEIDDLAQEVFLVAFKKLDTYRLGTDFAFWIKAIALNVARNARRQWYRRVSRIVSLAPVEQGLEDYVMEISESIGHMSSDSRNELIERFLDGGLLTVDEVESLCALLSEDPALAKTVAREQVIGRMLEQEQVEDQPIDAEKVLVAFRPETPHTVAAVVGARFSFDVRNAGTRARPGGRGKAIRVYRYRGGASDGSVIR